MLLFSMGASIDGFVADRDGFFGWSAPDDELFAHHLARVGALGGHLCGRRLYEDMLVWETDPALRRSPATAAFADVWTALPKVVFSRSPLALRGNARPARGPVAQEAEQMLAGTERDVEIGGADLAGQAVRAGLVDEFNVFRIPVLVGGGTPLPQVTATLALDLMQVQRFGPVVHERYRRRPSAPG